MTQHHADSASTEDVDKHLAETTAHERRESRHLLIQAESTEHTSHDVSAGEEDFADSHRQLAPVRNRDGDGVHTRRRSTQANKKPPTAFPQVGGRFLAGGRSRIRTWVACATDLQAGVRNSLISSFVIHTDDLDKYLAKMVVRG